jgi:sulfite reductase alpha subunit-like flavoprotein
VQSGKLVQLTPVEAVEELEIIIENASCVTDTILRSNHPSNWLDLRGTLPRDKQKMLEQIRYAKQNPGMLRSAGYRQL